MANFNCDLFFFFIYEAYSTEKKSTPRSDFTRSKGRKNVFKYHQLPLVQVDVNQPCSKFIGPYFAENQNMVDFCESDCEPRLIECCVDSETPTILMIGRACTCTISDLNFDSVHVKIRIAHVFSSFGYLIQRLSLLVWLKVMKWFLCVHDITRKTYKEESALGLYGRVREQLDCLKLA